MRGQLRQRSENRWAVILYLGRGPDGKEKRKWITVKGTRRDAQRELNRLLRDLDTGAFVEPAKTTVGTYLERWLADYAKQNVGGKTYEGYRNHLRTQVI